MTDQTTAGPDAPPAATKTKSASRPKIQPILSESPMVEAPAADEAPVPPVVATDAPGNVGAGGWREGAKRPLAILQRHRALAAALALGVGLGGVAGAGTVVALKGRETGPTAADWHRLAQRIDNDGSARLAAEVKGLREQVAALKDAGDRGRGDSGGRIAQLGDRLDKIQRSEQDLAKGVAALSERIERADRDEVQRFAALGDRIEKRLAAQPAAPAPQAAAAPKQADPVQTGAIPGQTQPAIVASWTLREVYDGIAMLENRNQRLLEVAPGSTVPGVGRVEAIERRGKSWVVVTNKGVITSQTW